MKSVRREDGVPSRPESGQSRILVRAYLACAALLSVYAWAVFVLSFRHDGLIGPRYNVTGADYMVYYTAARLFWENGLPLLINSAAFTARLNHDFAGWLASPLPPHPWVYPPPFLLLLAPFGLLPFAASYAAFMVATFVAAVAGACSLAEERVHRLVWVTALAMAPGTAIDAIAGQNALLTAGILLGGLGLLGRSPLAAGAVLGLMTYKPQFALMLPFAIVGMRNWRAGVGAALSSGGLAIASLVVLGPGIWRDWVEWLWHGNTDYAGWLEWGRLWGMSIYTCAALLGAGAQAAQTLQIFVSIVGGICVYFSFRRSLALDRRAAILFGATILAAPHVSGYDLVLLACAAAVLYRNAATSASPFPPLLLLLLWDCPLLGPPRASPAGFAVPLLAAALVTYALRAGRGRVAAAGPVAAAAGGT